ncbi:MAG TPA: glycerol-3-phosphate 1-O-acyltransferase PlsY [Cytophagaceae bacterium]|jgi:glycerol-3-phosphate acyltransferase PlsY|nr:glycerol-3-phosphate 1-O-acyltransferase PlsY [Cytophagaceae bacterium]
MNSEFYIVLSAIAAYLIGSFPTAVWYGKAYFGIDVREHGSGNSGATNTFRVLGKQAGIIVMAVDVLKGWTATQGAALLVYADLIYTEDLILFKLIFGIAAVIGHIFPIYVGFKGGKGIATLLGMVLSVHIEAALLCLLVFIVVLVLSKYVSLGSMIAALVFPILLISPKFRPDEHGLVVVIFGFVIFLLVVITHQKNIVRLLHGEENKAKIRIRRK